VILKLILLLTLSLTPLLTPVWGFGFENIKVLGFITLVSLAALIYGVNKGKLVWNKLQITSLLFILSLALTSALGLNFLDSVMGTAPYYQGLIFYLYLFVFSLLVGVVKIPLNWWILGLSASSLVVSFLAIKDYYLLESLNRYVPTYAGRVVSTFGQPNFYAGFILLTLPLTALLIESSKRWERVIGLLALTLGSLAISISLSKATIFLLLIFLIVWLLMRLPKWWGILISFFIGAVVSSYLYYSLTTYSWLYQEILQPFEEFRLVDKTPEKRIYIWEVMGQMVIKRPVLGYGLENISAGYKSYFEGINFNTLNNPAYQTLRDLNIDRAHNYILDLLLFSGVVGLLGWLGLVGVVIYQFIKTKSWVLLSALVLYLLWIQFHNQSVVQLIFFWWLVGIVSKSDVDRG
jgi:O-antigen ligase